MYFAQVQIRYYSTIGSEVANKSRPDSIPGHEIDTLVRVHYGGPICTVGGTIFEMWLGAL